MLLISNEDIAYLAGLIDGEGSICFCTDGKGKFPYPIVSIDTTDKELLDWIINTFQSGHVVKKTKYKDHHRQAYTWKVVYNSALEIIDCVYDQLKIDRKRKRANLLLTKYKSCTPRNGKYTPEMLKKKEELIQEWKTL